MTIERRQASVESVRSLVGFSVGGVRYALDVGRVREIVRPLEITPLPSIGAGGLLGVAHHRGEIVPVIDVRSRLGTVAAADARPKWLMVRLGDSRTVALVVDDVVDVFGATSADARKLPPLGPGVIDAVVGVYVHEGKLVLALDVEIVAAPVAQQLEAMAQSMERAVAAGFSSPGGREER